MFHSESYWKCKIQSERKPQASQMILHLHRKCQQHVSWVFITRKPNSKYLRKHTIFCVDRRNNCYSLYIFMYLLNLIYLLKCTFRWIKFCCGRNGLCIKHHFAWQMSALSSWVFIGIKLNYRCCSIKSNTCSQIGTHWPRSATVFLLRCITCTLLVYAKIVHIKLLPQYFLFFSNFRLMSLGTTVTLVAIARKLVKSSH